MSADQRSASGGEDLIIRRFAEDFYSNVVEINFQMDQKVHEAFGADLDVDTIIANLSITLDRTDIVSDSR